VHLSVDISKTDAAGITKLDIEMFHDESWKPFILDQMPRSKTKNIAIMCLCTLVIAGFQFLVLFLIFV